MDFFHTHVSDSAVELAAKTLRSGRLSEGIVVKEFEAALARELDLHNPIAVNSGTSALHLALSLCVGPGDEVVLPAQTFVATGMAVLYCGARPVFADIDPTTGNIDPASVLRKVTEKTRAVVCVDWAGLPCDLNELNTVCRTAGLRLVEDAAHALGARYEGHPVGNGSFVDYTCFSLQATKHLTTGDGGVLCCCSPYDSEMARKLRWFGIPREAPVSGLGERVYQLETAGYKYHLSDVGASIGLGNLDGFGDRLRRRQEVAARYEESFKNLEGLRPLRSPPDRTNSRYFFGVLVDRRADFVKAMAYRGVPTSVVCGRIDQHPVFGGPRTGDLPGQDEFSRKATGLSCHEVLTDDDVQAVIRAVQGGW